MRENVCKNWSMILVNLDVTKGISIDSIVLDFFSELRMKMIFEVKAFTKKY